MDEKNYFVRKCKDFLTDVGRNGVTADEGEDGRERKRRREGKERESATGGIGSSVSEKNGCEEAKGGWKYSSTSRRVLTNMSYILYFVRRSAECEPLLTMEDITLFSDFFDSLFSALKPLPSPGDGDENEVLLTFFDIFKIFSLTL